MRTTIGCATVGWLIISVGFVAAGGPKKPLEMPLFPDKMLGNKESLKEPEVTGQKPNTRIKAVSRPTITVFRPAKDKDTGTAVVIRRAAVTACWPGTMRAKRSRPG